MKYPAPTACKTCGVKEATAVCRWCGTWKYLVRALWAR